MEALAEELGDLLSHIVSHSEMARQAGVFDLGDVYAGIITKLIRRHPHVFGDSSVSGTGEVLRNWEAIKQAERHAKGQAPRGTLDGIPAGLPGLSAAQELTRKAAKRGFDWPALDDVWGKLNEELAELHEAARIDTSDMARSQRIEEELGDLLFAASNLARWLNVDAESALRVADAKFRRRFAYIEQQAQEQGRDLRELRIDELLGLWAAAKVTHS
jgi:tetrapyrrole methylase family protein/MazG family protein